MGFALHVALAAALLATAAAFYLPGIAAVDYKAGQKIEVLANRLTSPRNKLPYGYYSVPLCRPDGKVRSRPVNLGQVLVGERALQTKFEISMLENVQCRVMCVVDLEDVTPRAYKRLRDRIIQGYFVRLNADNMPAVVRRQTKTGAVGYQFGYKLGYTTGDAAFINNHLSIKILYHKPRLRSAVEPIEALTAHEAYRIVGFEVQPHSVAHNVDAEGALDGTTCPLPEDTPSQPVGRDQKIVYTYDVEFEESELAWATRWDPLLAANAELKKIQWFSIINSLMISLFLTALVGTVMLRTVLKDFVRYNSLDDEDDEDDGGQGWKNCHGDVFRPPKYAPFLCVCYGAGAQVLVMALLTLLFALVGFLSPANRGGLLTALLSLWVLASFVSGYASARLYASIETGAPRRIVTLGSAFLFPGITFSIFFALNLAMWFVGSSGSVSFTTLLLLLFMWFGISVPLVFVGSYVGYRRKPYEFPTRTNQIQRQIPPPPLGIKPVWYAVLAGILPFGVVFMEVVILHSSSGQQVYYVYGAAMCVMAILIVTAAEMSIVSTYLSLSAEDWASHWYTSFWGPGSAGLYVFLYSLYFTFVQQSHARVPLVSRLLVVSYSLIFSGAFALMCGTVGFYASLTFVRKIYKSIRID